MKVWRLPWLALLAAGGPCGCLLGNIRADGCSDDGCAAAFGLGSTCEAGFCSDPAPCKTGHDCRRRFGGGACVQGACTAALPPDPLGACTVFEPAGLSGRPIAGPGSPLVIGGMYRLQDSSDKPASYCPELAVRQINSVGGVDSARELAMVMCDGPTDVLSDDERKQRIFTIVDYLSGTLGVPLIIGPTTSSDAINAVTRTIAQRYPTLMISPSATSVALTTIQDKIDPAKDLYGLFWRTAPSDLLQTKVLVDNVVGQLPMGGTPVKKVAVVYLDDPYGEGLAKGFDAGWKNKGETQLFAFKGGKTQDWDTFSLPVAQYAPDAVLVVAVDAVDTVSFIIAAQKRVQLADKIVYATDGTKDTTQLFNPMLPPAVQTFISSKMFGTAPAAPQGKDFDAFAAALQFDFKVDAHDFAFTANGYDAAYVGAMGLVFAAHGTNSYDGRNVADGLAHLVPGMGVPPVSVGKTDWTTAKKDLTTDKQQLDVHGISGELDFDKETGEAPAPIEVWRPTSDSGSCGGKPPCFTVVKTVN